MYQEVGQVTPVTISELRSILSNVKWEVHVSDVTSHQAAICIEQVKDVDGIVALWPINTWQQLLFLRLGPGGKLYRHHDDGYGFHIPVETNEHAACSTFEDGVEVNQHLEVGKIYGVDRSIEHESFNKGNTDRTHLIILLKSNVGGNNNE